MDKYWIAFSSIEQIDSAFIQRLYNYFGDIETAYNASLSDLSQIDGLSVRKAETFIDKRKNIDLDKMFNLVLERGIKYFTFENPNYPKLLKEISNPPAVLYYKGSPDNCNFDKTLAIVGSRKSSFHAREAVEKIVSELQCTDICIVSGLASGIDTSAHKSALKHNLKTIGVIASGFDYIYPASNKHLYKEIEEGGGLVISEYYPTLEPLKFRFPQRNRIVSGLSYGTLVAEASLRSGALITANLTLEQGRELMCIPGLISNPNTEGIYKLLKNGATLVTCANDILEALNWEVKPADPLKIDLSDLSEDEEKILKALEVEEKGFDELSSITRINTNDLLINLTTMELKGIIKQLAGDRYKRV